MGSKLSDGVTGNTSDFGSEESRFETWSDNQKNPAPDTDTGKKGGIFIF
jgi:hypothetical protein